MISPNGAHGKSTGTILKSKGQMLRECGARNLQLEQELRKREEEAKEGVATIEQLTWQNSRRQITIMALGIHFELTPEAMHAIVKPYFDKQLEELQKQVEAVKDKFKDDLKSGKPIEFTVLENEQKPTGENEPAKEP